MNSSAPHSATAAFLAKQPWESLFSYLKQDSLSQFNALLTQIIVAMDDALSEQLSSVIQHSYFKQLESAWRGMDLLVSLPISQRRIKVKMLSWCWGKVANDLGHSFDLTQSALYKKIYSDEFDTAGGSPFGLILFNHHVMSDYRDEKEVDDLYTLQLLSELGEMALCPMVLGIDELFLGDDPLRLFHDTARAQRVLSSNDFSSWTLLREKTASRFLHLVLPDYLQRSSYQHYGAGFSFTERQEAERGLWGNSGFLLVSNVIREFDRINWFGFLRTYDNSASYGAIVQMPTPFISRVDLFSEEDSFWAEQGFIPLCSLYLSEQKGFFSNQSVWKCPDEDSRPLGMLQTNLMACRFSHYIKAQIRDKIGRFDTVADCKKSLERWLRQYTSNVDYAEDSVMARYPLKSFQVHIEESRKDKNRYRCEILLTPQYQCELVSVQVMINTAISYQEVK